ncbi:permease [Candidatus Peribacteria bacterium]|nr:permease [Candidatus Peribacteria bacterium]
MTTPLILALSGAFLSVFLSGLGSSMAVRMVGAKGTGVMAENPNLFGEVVKFTALPSSQGFYGVLIAILILVSMTADMDLARGIKLFSAGMIMGIMGLVSAIYQGKVSAACVAGVGRNESIGGRLTTLAALNETYAILALIVAVLLIYAV